MEYWQFGVDSLYLWSGLSSVSEETLKDIAKLINTKTPQSANNVHDPYDGTSTWRPSPGLLSTLCPIFKWPQLIWRSYMLDCIVTTNPSRPVLFTIVTRHFAYGCPIFKSVQCRDFNILRPSDAYMRQWSIIGSDNGLSPGRRQAIIRTNAGILLIGPLGIYVSEILIEIQTLLFTKMYLKISSEKLRLFRLRLRVSIHDRVGITPCGIKN